MKTPVILLLALFTSLGAFGAELTQRDAIANFIRDKMIGKVLVLQKSGTIPGAPVEYDFKRSTHFNDLQLTKNGLTFKKTWVIEQTNYDLDKDGKRIPGKVSKKDRIIVSMNELFQSSSTGAVIGLRRSISSTLDDPTGSGSELFMSIKDDVLTIKSKTIAYGDFFDVGDTTYPGVTHSTEIFQVKDGKLTSENTLTVFKVENPDTMELGKESPADIYSDSEL